MSFCFNFYLEVKLKLRFLFWFQFGKPKRVFGLEHTAPLGLWAMSHPYCYKHYAPTERE